LQLQHVIVCTPAECRVQTASSTSPRATAACPLCPRPYSSQLLEHLTQAAVGHTRKQGTYESRALHSTCCRWLALIPAAAFALHCIALETSPLPLECPHLCQSAC
jgi:hypothetical protein